MCIAEGIAYLQILDSLSRNQLAVVEVDLAQILAHRAEQFEGGVREEGAVVHG